MDSERLKAITSKYSSLAVAVVGDFCLDRYLEIDPDRKEISIETGLPAFNVAQVRSLPGGAGTIVNNLSALGIGSIFAIGIAGEDGEGFELCRALEQRQGVSLKFFVRTPQRQTFTYCKPLILHPNGSPQELGRFDFKNWTPTPALLQGLLINHLRQVALAVDAMIILDQVDVPETGVVTRKLLETLKEILENDSGMAVIADSRRSLRGFPPVIFKMNAVELCALAGLKGNLSLEEIARTAGELAFQNGRSVFATLAERGMVGTMPNGTHAHVPALPLRGEIDVVGAGDAVSANLAAAIVAGATLEETLQIANAAASVVIHKLGTTGTASVAEIEALLTPKA